MTFSVMSVHSDEAHAWPSQPPTCFGDLNLDQIVDDICLSRQEFDLKPLYYEALHDPDTVIYRQEIMQDLQTRKIHDSVMAFCAQMRTMREHLAQVGKLYYPRQQQRWFLEAVQAYCSAVAALAEGLEQTQPRSRGLQAMRAYVAQYMQTEAFSALSSETKALLKELSEVQYSMIIHESRISVRKFDGETDYSEEVTKTFAAFKQGAGKDYTVEYSDWPDMNHVEAQVLDLVAKLYHELFSHLQTYVQNRQTYLDPTIGQFHREIQFYLAYLEYIEPLQRRGLRFCYPQMSSASKEVHVSSGFDLALARKLMAESATVVCNDYDLSLQERALVVSGPNQGGKTTYARAFGQLHYLASLGLPVPAQQAQLFLFDRLFTHFEKEENPQDLSGKLQDDLVRIRRILDQATGNSIIILNEIFSSTTLQDAIFLGTKVMETIIALDALCVCVTFIDELASLGPQTVSLISTVVPENPAQRTFKIVRKPADGLAFAMSIAQKYGLTYKRLKERLSS